MLSLTAILAFVGVPAMWSKPDVVAPVKPLHEPFSRESVIAWLETQAPDKSYAYEDWKTCLVGQYTLAMGGKFDADNDYQIGDVTIPALGSRIATLVARPRPMTFGAALIRAKARL